MIKAEGKPLEEVRAMLKDFKKVLIVGCNTCVAVCFAGGEKEVESLASKLSLADKKDGIRKEYFKQTVQRQCENEFVDPLGSYIKKYDAVLSTACGIGVQTIADRFPKVLVFPAVNTKFMGRVIEPGYFFEYCGACGNCILGETAGVCPIARCAKGLLNGPCGGLQEGKCEVSKDIPCAWQLIYDRLEELGTLDSLEQVSLVKDWSSGARQSPQAILREDLRLREK